MYCSSLYVQYFLQFNSLRLSDTYMYHKLCYDWFQITAWCLFSAKLFDTWEIWIKIKQFSYKKIILKMSAKWWPFCLELNVLTHWGLASSYELTQYDCSISIVLTMEILQPSTNDVGSVTWENVLMKFLYHGGTSYIDGQVQDCGISIANAMEIPQSCTEPLMSFYVIHCTINLSRSSWQAMRRKYKSLSHLFVTITWNFMLNLWLPNMQDSKKLIKYQ